jgi:AcrR family transcriptional regulator
MSEDILSRGERTRAEIVRAAYQLFLTNGFHGTSTRQIAAEAGIALGGIYNHFTSKEEIFKAVLMEHHPFYIIMPAIEAAVGESVEDLVRDAAHQMVSVLGERLEFINLMFIELVEFKGSHLPEMFSIFMPKLMSFAQQLSAQRGAVRDIPPLVLVRAFIGLFFSYVITELLVGNLMPASFSKDTIQYFVEIYLHGIIANTGSQPGVGI